jgi:hypothetical protein
MAGLTTSMAQRMATMGAGIPMRCARSTAFCTISAFWWRFGAM